MDDAGRLCGPGRIGRRRRDPRDERGDGGRHRDQEPRRCLLSKYGSHRGRRVRGRAQGTPRRTEEALEVQAFGPTTIHGTSWRSGATVARCATTFTQRRRTPPPPARPDRPPTLVIVAVVAATFGGAYVGLKTYTQSQELSVGRDRDLHRPRSQGRARPVRAAGRLGRAVRGAIRLPVRLHVDLRTVDRDAPSRASRKAARSTCRTSAPRPATRSPRTCAR